MLISLPPPAEIISAFSQSVAITHGTVERRGITVNHGTKNIEETRLMVVGSRYHFATVTIGESGISCAAPGRHQHEYRRLHTGGAVIDIE